jgi:TPP-dependent indolepyruvate ferredoxin oxidoreductase alpha subunit
MENSIKISRIKRGNEFFNVVTGNKADLMAMSFALLKSTTGDKCPVLIIGRNNSNILVAREEFIEDPVKLSKCKICEGCKSCPVASVLKAHKDNWKRISGKVSKEKKPRKTPLKYVKITVE